jgi:RNA polymerase sigma factor (TIGR02999 family)
MEHPAQAELTRLLSDDSLGDSERARRLLPLVYEHLRGLARSHMSTERSDHTLQPTALVHEAYVKLVDCERDAPWQGKAHFYSAAAEAMRRILIDHARGRNSQKRGGDRRRRVSLNLAEVSESWDLSETLSLDAALSRMSEHRPSVAEVVRLRFFAGLSVDETAKTMGLSPATVKRRWEFGRTWLFRELSKGDGDGG